MVSGCVHGRKGGPSYRSNHGNGLAYSVHENRSAFSLLYGKSYSRNKTTRERRRRKGGVGRLHPAQSSYLSIRFLCYIGWKIQEHEADFKIMTVHPNSGPYRIHPKGIASAVWRQCCSRQSRKRVKFTENCISLSAIAKPPTVR